MHFYKRRFLWKKMKITSGKSPYTLCERAWTTKPLLETLTEMVCAELKRGWNKVLLKYCRKIAFFHQNPVCWMWDGTVLAPVHSKYSRGTAGIHQCNNKFQKTIQGGRTPHLTRLVEDEITRYSINPKNELDDVYRYRRIIQLFEKVVGQVILGQ